jgi:rhamnogalacturonan endolyase
MKRALIPFVASVLISAVLPDDATAAFSGYYRLLARHSGKALNVTGNGTADGADIVQWPAPSAQPNDQWEISDVGSGYYRITARHSGKVVNVEGNSTAEGANVVQWTYNSANLNSQWQVADAGSGYYRGRARRTAQTWTRPRGRAPTTRCGSSCRWRRAAGSKGRASRR